MERQPMDVLVVDDSAVMRAMILKSLRMAGLPLGACHQAGSGRAGLDVLAGCTVDLVIADINMPGMSGEEMIDRMREDPRLRSVPVVVCSTDGTDTRVASLRSKGVGFVQKPQTPGRLLEAIRAVTEGGGA